MESVSPIENCIVRHVNTNKTQIIHKRLVNGLFQVFLLEISALDLRFDLLNEYQIYVDVSNDIISSVIVDNTSGNLHSDDPLFP